MSWLMDEVTLQPEVRLKTCFDTTSVMSVQCAATVTANYFLVSAAHMCVAACFVVLYAAQLVPLC